MKKWVPTEPVVKVDAAPVSELPLPAVIAKGELVQSNLDQVLPKFDQYLENIKTELATDQDFADATANAKQCREMAKKLGTLAEAIISQMATVSEVDKLLKLYKDKMNAMGLQLEKSVKAQKDALKDQAIMLAKDEYSAYFATLNLEIHDNVSLQKVMPDFAGAIKGVKTTETMQSRINDALAEGKRDLNIAANDIKTKLAYIEDAIKGKEHLFNLQDLIALDIDHIKLQIKDLLDAEEKRIADAIEAEKKAETEEVKDQEKKSAPAAIVSAKSSTSAKAPEQTKSEVHDTVTLAAAIASNVDNEKMSDAEFRNFVRESLAALSEAA